MSMFTKVIRGFAGGTGQTEGPVEAVWNGAVLAASEATIVVEGNHYFPPESVDWDLLRASDRTSVCPWKGRAGYYDIHVDGSRNEGAAWVYADPKSAAAQIKDHVAFWRGVEVGPPERRT